MTYVGVFLKTDLIYNMKIKNKGYKKLLSLLSL